MIKRRISWLLTNFREEWPQQLDQDSRNQEEAMVVVPVMEQAMEATMEVAMVEAMVVPEEVVTEEAMEVVTMAVQPATEDILQNTRARSKSKASISPG